MVHSWWQPSSYQGRNGEEKRLPQHNVHLRSKLGKILKYKRYHSWHLNLIVPNILNFRTCFTSLKYFVAIIPILRKPITNSNMSYIHLFNYTWTSDWKKSLNKCVETNMEERKIKITSIFGLEHYLTDRKDFIHPSEQTPKTFYDHSIKNENLSQVLMLWFTGSLAYILYHNHAEIFMSLFWPVQSLYFL